MESQNIDNSQDGQRASIPVVNGEARPSKGRKRTALLSLIVLVLIAGLSSSLFLLKEERQRADEFGNQAFSLLKENAELKTEARSEILAESEDGAKQYREIPELGLKYEFNEKTKDLTYFFESSVDEDGRWHDSILLSSTALSREADKSKDAIFYNCTSKDAPVGTIKLREPDDPVDFAGETPAKDFESIAKRLEASKMPVRKISGSVYVQYSYTSGPVTSKCKNKALMNKTIDVWRDAFESIQPMTSL